MTLTYALETVPMWTAVELSQLPSAEDESHEYKSSRIAFADLRREISIAASAFWNTGGGVLAAGVDGSGRADGGINVKVGRQPLRDWVDQCVADVSPTGQYRVAMIEETSSVAAGHCVLVIAFGESHLAPHMAPDRRYYMRAGAHTVPAPHFVVEALMARRGLSQPLLRPMLRQSPNVGYVLQLGIVAASNTPALDVAITLPPLPYLSESEPTSISVGVIGPDTPFFFDFHVLTMGEHGLPPFPVTLTYYDVAGRPFDATFQVDVEAQLGQTLAGDPGDRRIVRQLEDIEKVLKTMAASIKSNEQSLRAIANKLK
jgi:hypothetical protein